MGLSGPLIFYGVSGPSAARDFILAMLQNVTNPRFLRGFGCFGLQEGPGAEKLAS